MAAKRAREMTDVSQSWKLVTYRVNWLTVLAVKPNSARSVIYRRGTQPAVSAKQGRSRMYQAILPIRDEI